MRDDPGSLTHEERREPLRRLASNDAAIVAEAAALLRHEVRAYAAAGRDPADVLPTFVVMHQELVRIARGAKLGRLNEEKSTDDGESSEES